MTSKSIRDAGLIAQYRETKNLVFLQELYLDYQPYIYRQCMSILKHAQDSEDASVDVFLELQSKLLIHQVTNFSSWLYSLVRNLCLKKLKIKSRMLVSELTESREKSEIPEKNDLLVNLLDKMPSAIDQLKSDQRWCIVLFYLHGLSYHEIEQLKGYSFNKIKSSIQHGKKNLRKILETNHE